MRSTDQIVPAASHKKTTKNKRKHRRVRSDWTGCKCPEGSEYKSTPRITRGWTCLKKTPKGPRFVRAVCNISNVKSLPAKRKMLPANTLFGVKSNKTSSSASKKKRALFATDKILTGSACGCPEGAKRIKTKLGSRCQRNGKFVKAACITNE